jgi:hypothetical protein
MGHGWLGRGRGRGRDKFRVPLASHPSKLEKGYLVVHALNQKTIFRAKKNYIKYHQIGKIQSMLIKRIRDIHVFMIPNLICCRTVVSLLTA